MEIEKIGSEFLVNSETASSQYEPAVTSLADGGFVITWYTDDTTQDGEGFAIKAQVFDADGTPQGDEFLVNSETTSYQYDPTVSGLSDGGFVITWRTDDTTQDGDGTAIKAQVFDADGTAVGGEFVVNSETVSHQIDPKVTSLADGGFVITWRTDDTTQDGDGTAIKAQVFDADGTPQGDEFLVNSETTSYQYDPTVSGLSDGGFVITWRTHDTTQDGDGTAIKAQVFDADGTPQGGEFLVNSETTSYQYEPTVSGLSDGGFVITWFTSDTTQDGDGYAIKAQVFDADGTAVGGEFLVNSETTDWQYEPTVTGLSDGGFVITWRTHDTTQDGEGTAIKAQVFDADGTPQGDEFLVNSETASSQYEPAVTGLSDGGFAITWLTTDSTQDGEGTAIKAQVFSVSSDLIGTPDPDRLVGGESDDLLIGLAGDDTLKGGDGADVLRGKTGNDVIRGQDGDDFLYGGNGDDELRGGAGSDELTGGDGIDILYGGVDDDFLKGGADNDLLFGNSGMDVLQGGSGNDELSGGNGADQLRGNSGDDQLRGGADADELSGNSGDDELSGGSGDDILDGGKGNDTLNGGKGNDILTGGANADVFVFNHVSGSDTITDFNADRDMIEITNGAQDIGDLVFTQSGDDTTIQFADTEIEVLGITVGELQDADLFVFS